jgi:hypothetical protein
MPICRVKLISGQEISVSVTEMAEYIAGNRSKDVATVHLRLPIPLLSTGMTIVDPPGVNVSADRHDAQTAEAIKAADACVFLMHADMAASKTSVEFLRKIQLTIGKFFFVINQADNLKSEDQREVAEYVRKHLIEDCGFPNPRVVLICSNPKKIHSSNVWKASFASFKNDLRRFMDTEADLVVAKALAPLIEDVIFRANELLSSKSRLAERELAAHYRASFPDSVTLIQRLRAEIRARTEDEGNAIAEAYAKYRIEVCSDLDSRVKRAIESAQSKLELKELIDTGRSNAPQIPQIVRHFQDHETMLRTFLENSFGVAFCKMHDQIEETFRGLLTGVTLLEFRAFFSYRVSIIAILMCALGLPGIEWLTGASQQALLISPILGACLGIVLYGCYFWRMSRIAFQSAIQYSIAPIGAGELVKSLTEISKGFWKTLFELIGITSLEEIGRAHV